jgi:hypothetical protein
MTDETQLKILIADDEPLAAERLQMLLARIEGVHLVGTAHDGESAVRMAEALDPNLVLLDIAMPGLDGIEVARALSRRGESPAVVFNERLWSRLGAEDDGFLVVDDDGTPQVGLSLNIRLRDLARFGELMRNGGRLNDEQIIPSSVIEDIRRGGSRGERGGAYRRTGRGQGEGGSGHHRHSGDAGGGGAHRCPLSDDARQWGDARCAPDARSSLDAHGGRLVAAGGDHDPVTGVEAHTVFRRELFLDCYEQWRDAGNGLVAVVERFGEEPFDLRDRGFRWAVSHDTLAERNRARAAPDEIRDNGDDG